MIEGPLHCFDQEKEMEVCEEPMVIAVGKFLYEVIAESADGWKLIMPLNMTIIKGVWRDADKAGSDVLQLKRENRGE